MGTTVKATQAESASALSAENAAAEVRPSSAATLEYSASSSAAESETTEMAKVRQAGQSTFSRQGPRLGGAWCLANSAEAIGLQRDGGGVQNLGKNGLGLRHFLLGGGVARVHHDAVGENGQHHLLEVVRQAEVAALDESPGLGRALQHQRAARAYAQHQAFVLPRLLDNF